MNVYILILWFANQQGIPAVDGQQIRHMEFRDRTYCIAALDRVSSATNGRIGGVCVAK